MRRRPSTHAIVTAALLLACAPAERPPADGARPDGARPDSVRPDGAAAVPAASALDTTAASTGTLGPLLERPLGACAPATAAAAGDTLCYRAERRADLAGDGRPFTVTVDARGARPDSMAVQVRITRGDTAWYAAHWNTVLYGRYDAAPLPTASDTVRRRTAAHLGRLLRDDAFMPVRAMLRGAAQPMTMLRETLVFDVAEAKVRARRGLAPADTLTRAQLEEVYASFDPEARSGGADGTRIRTLADEMIGRQGWRFYRGGENTSGIAWSPTERRFVLVASCC